MNLLWRIIQAPFKPKPKVTPERQVITSRPSSNIRMREWRANPDAVKAASLVLQDLTLQNMLDVLRTENPCHMVLMGRFSLEERGIMQARIEGYSMCLNNLENLGRFESPVEGLQEEFADPEAHTPAKHTVRPITPFPRAKVLEQPLGPPPEPTYEE